MAAASLIKFLPEDSILKNTNNFVVTFKLRLSVRLLDGLYLFKTFIIEFNKKNTWFEAFSVENEHIKYLLLKSTSNISVNSEIL